MKISKATQQGLLKGFLTNLCEVPKDEWDYYISQLDYIALKKGDVFCHQGENFDKSTFVCSGLLQGTHIDEKSSIEIIKRFYGPNMKMGPYREMLEEKPSEMTITAVTDCYLIASSIRLIDGLRLRHSCWEIISRKLIEQELIYSERKSQLLLLRSPEERYNLFLEEYPEVCEKVSNRRISQYLGISDVSLSRIRARQRKEIF